MIRRNSIAVAIIGLLVALSGVALWTTSAMGLQTDPVAQPSALPQSPGYGTYPGAGQDKGAAGAPQNNPLEKKVREIAPAALVGKKSPQMGAVVTDGTGRTLYRFDKDQAKPEPKSNCTGPCEQTWPPLLTSAERPMAIEGVDPAIVGTTPRPDGTQQVTIGGWPVYTYSGDPGPGKWKGQGVGGTWFVVAPDGSRNVSCLPPGVTPPADKGGAKNEAPKNEAPPSGQNGYTYG